MFEIYCRMRRMVDDFFVGGVRRVITDRNWAPAIDVYNKTDEYVLHAEIPVRVQKSDVSLELLGDNNLIIKGEVKHPEGLDRKNLIRNERDCGKFSREIQFPGNLQTDKASAEIENGILEVKLPKAQPASKKIEIS